MTLELFADNPVVVGQSWSTLSAPYTAGATTLAVVSNTPYPAADPSANPATVFRVRLDNEILLVTDNRTLTWVVAGAQEGSTAANHASGVQVFVPFTKGSVAGVLATAASDATAKVATETTRATTAEATAQAAAIAAAATDATTKANAAQAAATAASQPLDSDLTAIAALTTTSFGRALLALADAAAGRTAFGLGTAATQASSAFDAAGLAAAAQAASQPVDSDLTAIAALTTTAYGRAFLALADAAAARTALALGTIATHDATEFLTTATASATYVADLADRTSAVTETVPVSTTTNATTAGVTLTAPALSNPVGTIPQRFAIRNASTATITVAYPADPAGTATTLTVLPGEVLTFRQKSLVGWAAESGNKPLASLNQLFKVPDASRSPLVAKTRGKLVIPNTWTNTAQKAHPENAVWDPDLNLYVGVYMAEQTTPSSFTLVCYWTAPSLAAIKAGLLTDGGVVSGMSGGAQTPHLMREGSFWYIFAANTGVSNIDIWRSTTSPAGAGAYSKVQTSIITRGAVASISTPATPTVTPTTGTPGTIAASTASYKVTALTAAGETTASNAASGTLASSGFFTVSWTAVTGATGYNVYKQTAPGNLYLLVGTVVGNATVSYQDNTGTPVTPQQQPMLTNISASFDLTFALEQYVVRIPTRDPLWAQGYRFAMYYMGQSSGTNPEQVGVAVSATLNATGWVKLNNGNPIIGASGGYANDSEGAADPFIWFAPNGKIVVFYVAIEAGGVGKTMHWHYAAAVADQISGPYTKLGTVIDTPCYPDVGSGGSATWSTGTYPRMAQMNGDEGGVWRGAFLRNDIDNEVLWMHSGKNMTAVGNTTTTVAGFLDTFDLASPLLRGIVAVEPWERVEIESGDPRWVLAGTWTSQSTSEWSGGSMKFSSTVNDTATFFFEGIAVRVGLGGLNNCGIVDIYIDGVYDRTLDLYNPGSANHSPVTYEKLGLTPGGHKVMVKVVGKNAASSNTVVVVDYAEVLGSGVGL